MYVTDIENNKDREQEFFLFNNVVYSSWETVVFISAISHRIIICLLI